MLVGDNRQLPPFHEEALLDPDLLAIHGISRDVLETTLFDILLEQLPQELVVSLREQRRMLPAIGGLISEVFYEGELLSVDREQYPHVALILGVPMLWINTAGHPRRHDQSAGTSYVNVLEATEVCSLLERLEWAANAANHLTSVVVLSGYAAQHGEVESLVSRLQLPNLSVEVATIDAYQGREADVAILSLTRSNQQGILWLPEVDAAHQRRSFEGTRRTCHRRRR
jgi:superfamily I DNA and/or RNA helicase